jgi:hypothetical protein
VVKRFVILFLFSHFHSPPREFDSLYSSRHTYNIVCYTRVKQNLYFSKTLLDLFSTTYRCLAFYCITIDTLEHTVMAMNGKTPRQRTTLSINPGLYAQAKKIAMRDRRDISTVLEMALEAYILTWKQNKRRLEAPEGAGV